MAGGAFHQIIDGADNDRAAGSRVELESNVAEVGAVHGAHIRQAAKRIKAHELLGLILAAIDIQQFVAGLDIASANVDGFQDAAIEWAAGAR